MEFTYICSTFFRGHWARNDYDTGLCESFKASDEYINLLQSEELSEEEDLIQIV